MEPLSLAWVFNTIWHMPLLGGILPLVILYIILGKVLGLDKEKK
jgi:hypothetical protein